MLGRGASGGCLSPGSLTSPTEAHLLPPGLHIQPVLVIFYVLLSSLSNTVLESLAINTISALMSDAAAWTARLYAHCRRWESVKASQVCLWRKIMHFKPLAPSLLNVKEYVWMSGTTYIVVEGDQLFDYSDNIIIAYNSHQFWCTMLIHKAHKTTFIQYTDILANPL